MLRACLLATAFAIPATTIAADLPNDISPEARAEVIKKLQDVYYAERDKRKAKVADAETLTKVPATAAEGKKKLAAAKADLERLDSNPAGRGIPKSPLVLFGDVPAAKGLIGVLNVGGWSLTATEILPEGVLVEGVQSEGGRVNTARYLIASPIEVPKAKGKTAPAINLPGLWYVAGTTEIKGKAVPVLYKFEIKKDDFPPEKK